MSGLDPGTYAELMRLPAHLVGEIVGGVLFASPRGAGRQALATSGLGALLGAAFQFARGGPGGWWILDRPELHLGNDVLVPDVAGWRRDRMPDVPDEPFFSLPPDWVCEVISPRTAKLDLGLKLPSYAACGVSHAWVVDPLIRAIQIFDLRSRAPVLIGAFAGADRARALPFEEVEIELAHLWGDGRQAASQPDSPAR